MSIDYGAMQVDLDQYLETSRGWRVLCWMTLLLDSKLVPATLEMRQYPDFFQMWQQLTSIFPQKSGDHSTMKYMVRTRKPLRRWRSKTSRLCSGTCCRCIQLKAFR